MQPPDPHGAGLGRREFLRRALAGAIVPSSVTGLIAACADPDGTEPPDATAGYGAVDRERGPLLVPRDFEVRAFGRVGDVMSDGTVTPIAHDGMAAFAGADGRVRLVRNHEDRNGPTVPIAVDHAYDPVGGGGTTTMVVRPDRQLEADFVSLAGTAVNCAGGPTPWGSWLSCEETVVGTREGFARTHGWVFEVPASADGPVPPVPITGMGRFSHEAVAVDPDTGIVYQTEDHGFIADRPFAPGSGLYRYLPDRPGELHAGGRLQMLAVEGSPQLRLFRGAAAGIEVGDAFPARWVDIDFTDPDPDDRLGLDERLAATFLNGFEKGAAAFDRLEGCWFGDGSLFFHDTSGGAAGLGQVWQYTPAPGEGSGGADDTGTLRLIFESSDADVLNHPDNITVSPRGGLVLCEDPSGVPYLRGLTPGGMIFDFARNDLNAAEFAGATFSPDGQTLFVNIQGSTHGSVDDAEPGITLAIWGPWERGAL